MKPTARVITTAAALGLGTLTLRPADWWPWVRGTYVVAPGMLAGGATASAMNLGSLRADAGIEGWLSRRGVRHPRRWMAGTAAVSRWPTTWSTPQPQAKHRLRPETAPTVRGERRTASHEE